VALVGSATGDYAAVYVTIEDMQFHMNGHDFNSELEDTLPPGSYSLFASTCGHSTETLEIDLSPDEIKDVSIEF
jgi:hypothetical protein